MQLEQGKDKGLGGKGKFPLKNKGRSGGGTTSGRAATTIKKNQSKKTRKKKSRRAQIKQTELQRLRRKNQKKMGKTRGGGNQGVAAGDRTSGEGKGWGDEWGLGGEGL